MPLKNDRRHATAGQCDGDTVFDRDQPSEVAGGPNSARYVKPSSSRIQKWADLIPPQRLPRSVRPQESPTNDTTGGSRPLVPTTHHPQSRAR
jgi:hypothetical protein